MDAQALQGPVTGRFAPSPTGPLHLGSLAAAVASFVDARSAGGRWLVRIEDIDEPRTVPGAADAILRCLESYGLEWDSEPVYQSRRKRLYRDALNALGPRAFPCACSHVAGIYPGTCRRGLPSGSSPRAVRLRVDDAVIDFVDRIAGPRRDALAETVGDFVLLRADGYFAYQLAVVVDDEEQGVTDVVRGEDLLDSTGRQILLQRLLGYRTPRYAHVRLVRDATGEKLSKQTNAPPVPFGDDATLAAALRFLDLPEMTVAQFRGCNFRLLSLT